MTAIRDDLDLMALPQLVRIVVGAYRAQQLLMRRPGSRSVPSRMRSNRRRYARIESEHTTEALLATVDIPRLNEILIDAGRVAKEPTVDPDGDDIVCYAGALGIIDIHAGICANPAPCSVSGRWRSRVLRAVIGRKQTKSTELTHTAKATRPINSTAFGRTIASGNPRRTPEHAARQW